MISLNHPPFPSSSRRYPHHYHLLITSLAYLVNALLISIIAYQFLGTVTSASEIGHTSGVVSARNARTSNHHDSYSTHRAPAECTQEPRFSILISESLLKSANVSYDAHKAEIWTFGRIYLILECRASSPIDFTFDGHLINKLRSVETARITYDDPRMPECYTISLTVETNRESTGNYSCWSLQEPILSTSLYIFAHGGMPPFLLHADIGITVIEVETDIHDLTVIIPCVVTNPNISVALYKVVFEGFTPVPIGDYLSYDPKLGFLLQVRKYPDPYGKYKCIAMNSSHYDVIVHVKQPTDNFFHDPIVQGRLELVQDRFSQSFICNSSSENPTILTTADCTTPIDCRLAGKCLAKNAYCSGRCRCPIRGEACSKTLESNYAQIGFPVGPGCQTLETNRNGGVVKCSAVNFEPSAEVTYFIGLNGRTVQNWRNAATDELIQVSTTLYEESSHALFYVGEWIEFTCRAARFLFSRGFKWRFQLVNGTIIDAETKAISSQLQENGSYIAENMRVRISNANISSVLCYAPLWNETTWEHNTLPLNVKDSVAPTFLNPENTTLTFYINDLNNSIVCEAEGFPTPDILWLKDDEQYIQNIQLDYSIANVTRAHILLPDLSLFDDGSAFVCNATNPAGTIMKVFIVRVRESLKLTLTLAGVAFILLLGVFGIIIWIFYTNSRRMKIGQFYAFTDQEIEDFYSGNPDAIKKCGDGVTKAIYHPYDQTFEINSDDLLIDYQSPLGTGQFGVVLRGKLQTKQGAFPVAVKTTKDSDVSQLRTLLSEIKIMMYIGKHENIVNLIGSITKELKKREVFVVVEYCQFGSLEEYLRNHRGTFFDEFGTSGMSRCATPVSYVRLECLVKTSDLISWAYQISSALEYLTSKKVIHGDVALRNMLLDANQTIKVTDFGLSKHIYTQTNQYVTNSKKNDVPLPWRWLAPETLKDHVFSLNSDVWSFGVLLYELFSLAEIPYTGINYSEEFLRLVGNGFRLNKPPYANGDIYATMRDCWRLDPKERPTFTSLRHFFLQFIRMQHPLNQSEIIQQMQYRSELDTDSSDLDKEESTIFVPPTLSSNASSIVGQRPKVIVA